MMAYSNLRGFVFVSLAILRHIVRNDSKSKTLGSIYRSLPY